MSSFYEISITGEAVDRLYNDSELREYVEEFIENSNLSVFSSSMLAVVLQVNSEGNAKAENILEQLADALCDSYGFYELGDPGVNSWDVVFESITFEDINY